MTRTNQSLVDDLVRTGALTKPRLIKAFRKVDRADFVPTEHRSEAYGDYPLPIGPQATISQPSTVAMMLEWLVPKPGHRVLDLGSGSGWTVALLAEAVGPKGHVFGLELDPELAEAADRRLKRYTNAHVLVGDGRLGLPKEAPFDRIIVAAAAPEPNRRLRKQLGEDGRLVEPVGDFLQDIAVVTRTGPNQYREERHPGFRFVPMRPDKPSGS